MRTFVIAAVALIMAGPAVAQQRDVTIRGSDGVQLGASYADAGKSGPGFLLLPACNGDRKMFSNLADLLSAAGYNVLSLDYRRSGGTPGDIDAGLAFLASQENVNASRLGVVGVECGVGHAVAAARRNSAVKAVVLVAGSADAAGIEHFRTTKMPVLAAADQKDASAAKSLKEVVAASNNPDSSFVALTGAAEGANLFAKEPDLEVEVVLWNRKGFPVASYAPLK